MSGSKPPYRVPLMREIEEVPANGLSVVSTFSGGGGSCLGYRMAGYRVLYASEFIPEAQKTYRFNHPGVYLDTRDIRQVTPESILEIVGKWPGEIDLLDGSPPCCAFSVCGKREKGNRFYELMTGKEDDDDNVWSRHVVDIYQAVSQGLDRNLELLRKGCGDPDAWAQEYELQWLDESTAWLPFSLITDAEDDEAGNPSHSCGGPCFIGVDIGRRHDLFVIWVLEKVGDVLWTREVIERRGATFAEQDALLDDVFARYNVARCCMDQTGMGEKPLEDAQRRHGASCVEGVLFTATNKLALATLGKQAFEERKMRIPMGVQALRADLHKLRKVSGPTGTPRFVADSDSDGHADRTWACFLAVSASSSPGFEYGYTPAGNARDDFYGMDDDDDARGAW